MKHEYHKHMRVLLTQEDDGRWFGVIEDFPGVMAYGNSQDAAFVATVRLCMEVIQDRLENGEPIGVPEFDSDRAPENLSFERELVGS